MAATDPPQKKNVTEKATKRLNEVFASMSPPEKTVADLVYEELARAKQRVMEERAGMARGFLHPSHETLKIEEEILELRKKIQAVTDDKNRLEATVEAREKDIESLDQKIRLASLLNSVSTHAHQKITADSTFRDQFFDSSEKKAFIVSIDIRRSTELMLKARSPKGFSDFITELCASLSAIIKDNFGIVDKFTGDGVLAFFPEFYSGSTAGLHALNACARAIEKFESHYNESRSTFNAILRGVGLGIGIDYGNIHLLEMAGSLTAVGQPVVYACRLGGAPAGRIYANQPAFEQLWAHHKNEIEVAESSLTFKHEGEVVCYDVRLRDRCVYPCYPSWCGDPSMNFEQAQPSASKTLHPPA